MVRIVSAIFRNLKFTFEDDWRRAVFVMAVSGAFRALSPASDTAPPNRAGSAQIRANQQRSGFASLLFALRTRRAIRLIGACFPL